MGIVKGIFKIQEACSEAFYKQLCSNQKASNTAVIPEFGKWGQEDQNSKAILRLVSVHSEFKSSPGYLTPHIENRTMPPKPTLTKTTLEPGRLPELKIEHLPHPSGSKGKKAGEAAHTPKSLSHLTLSLPAWRVHT